MSPRRPLGTALAIVIAMTAGTLGAVQPKINAVLAERVGAALLASLVNFTAALGVAIVVLVVAPSTRRLVRRVRTWDVPWWTMTAGLGGAVIVLSATLAVETIGVAIFSVAFFAGQITFGLLVDRLGVGPGGRRPIGTDRAVAALVAVAAVLVSQIGREPGEFSPPLVAFVVFGGAAFAFQSAFNGRIAAVTGDALAATTVNVVVGWTALAAVVWVASGTGVVDSPVWPSEPLLYTGGVLGVTIVLSLTVATRAMGVFRTTIAMLAAQLIVAFLVDLVVEGVPPTPGAVAGGVLILASVAVVARAREAALQTS